MMSCFRRLRSSSVLATGTSANGGHKSGIDSPAYEPGPYSTEYEDGVLQFIDWYTTTMSGRLSGGAGKLKSVA